MKRLRAWAGTHRKQAWLLAALFVLLVLLAVGARMLTVFLEVRNGDDAFFALDMAGLEVSGYAVEDGVYTLEEPPEEAYIRFEGLDRTTTNLMVYFTHPLAQDLPIEMRYEATTADGYARETLRTRQMHAGDPSVEFILGGAYHITALAFRIGEEAGDSFELWEVLTKPARKNSEAMLELFFWAVFLACFAAVCVTALLVWRGVRLHILYLCVAGILGFAMMFVLTPFSAPDEEYHYHSALQVADAVTFSGGTLRAEYYRFDGLVGHENNKSGYFRLMDDIFRTQLDWGEADLKEWNVGPYRLQYLPQTVGVVIAKALGLNFLGVFYWGRFTNLLFFLACVTLAIRKLAHGKQLFFLIGVLPMALHQAASYSPDGFINGAGLWVVATQLSVLFGKGRIPRRDLVVMWIFSVLLAPSKLIFLFLPLVLLMAPRERFGSRRFYWAYLGSIMVAATALVIYAHALSFTGHIEAGGAIRAGQQSYTLPFISHYPARTLEIFLRSLEEMSGRYFMESMGYHLSGGTMELPTFPFLLLALLLFVAAAPRRDQLGWLPTHRQRWGMGGVVAAVLGSAMFAMFLGWTPGNQTIILGVQGRYFIPVLPLVFFLLRSARLSWDQKPPYALLVCGVLVTCYAVLYMVRYTVDWLV